ncbi:MAG: hypothetical protein GF383_16635 [Candidatus Lokiarchaeota archaeon]|nr:hypothetical protein [Candidatus Lokiarchaeota archaeon]MBD3343414.1 hypothetical protein [Candidatus Lokiarchaeota archaeon]
MTERHTEVRNLMKMSPEEVIEKAGDNLIVKDNLEDLYVEFAREIYKEIRGDYKDSDSSRIILPVGPVEQYDFLFEMLKTNKISLNNCMVFFMDEYCNENGKALGIQHPLSFKRIATSKFINPLKEFGLKDDQVIFPNEVNIGQIDSKIERMGGIDTTFGGIGIHGHVAFNEPEKGVAQKGSRRVTLNNYTITINAIRSNIGGNLENFPKEAFTLGLNTILASRRIVLCCRSDILDWASTILRIALFGNPGDDYPATYVQKHPNYLILTDKNTLKTPKNII